MYKNKVLLSPELVEHRKVKLMDMEDNHIPLI